MNPPGTARMRISILVAYFLIYFVWGSTYYFIGVALRGLPPFLLGALRFTAAGLLLLLVCRAKGEKVFDRALVKASAVSGIVLLFIDMAVVMLAQQYITSSLVAILVSSTAIWITALDFPMWKFNFKTPRILVGIAAGFVGVALLYAEQVQFDGLESQGRYGVLIILLGCISWALGTIYTKYRTPTGKSVYAFSGSAWQMIFAGAAFWTCSLITGDVHTDLSTVTTGVWLSLSYLIVFGSILAYTAYIWLLKVRPATEVATHAYVNPFVAMLLGYFLGRENITLIQILGLLVIVTSVMLVNKAGKRLFSFSFTSIA